MQEDRNLYMYVYRMILTSIYNGTYQNKGKLPSISQLCETFQVGKNTIRSALQLLQDDDYIQLRKGSHAEVCFNVQDMNTNVRYKQALMDAREMTRDVYETMSFIVPELFFLCFQKGNTDIAYYKKLLETFTVKYIHSEAELIKAMYKVYLEVFESYDNPIILDLFYTLLSYSYQPIVPQEQTYKKLQRSVNGIRRSVRMILQLACTKQDKVAKQLVRIVINMHGKNSLSNIDRICADMQVQNKSSFVWVCNRKSEYLYTKVVVDILMDIVTDTYQIEDALPSISQLAIQHDVSERTIRKALEILRYFEVIETINGRGSIVRKKHFSMNDPIIENQDFQNSLKMYQNTLEIMRVLLLKILPIRFESIKKEELKMLSEKMKEVKMKTLEPITTYIFQPYNPCLQAVYEELRKSLTWCVFADMIDKAHSDRMRELRGSVVYYLENGNINQILEACMAVLNEDEQHVTSIIKKGEN